MVCDLLQFQTFWVHWTECMAQKMLLLDCQAGSYANVDCKQLVWIMLLL
jgi:hypothetical protein